MLSIQQTLALILVIISIIILIFLVLPNIKINKQNKKVIKRKIDLIELQKLDNHKNAFLLILNKQFEFIELENKIENITNDNPSFITLTKLKEKTFKELKFQYYMLISIHYSDIITNYKNTSFDAYCYNLLYDISEMIKNKNDD